jgi:DNA replication and repair protein RecF
LDLVFFGRDSAKVEGSVNVEGERGELVCNLQVVDGRVGKSYFINSSKKRFTDFSEEFAIVVFAPVDMDLVSGSPSLRRRHLDVRLSSVDRDYGRSILAYGKLVTRRNKVLQRIWEGKSKPLELSFWDERLSEYGKYISKKREEFFEYLNFVNATVGDGQNSGPQIRHSRLDRESDPRIREDDSIRREFGDLSWELKQSTISVEKLLKNRERDIAAGITLSGPHRDDFRFRFRGRDLEFFGSRGEQRMAVLALKLAELEYYKMKKGYRPILALDDIFSELDWEHRDTVLSVIGNQQTIITAAEEESIPKEIFKKAKVIRL